MNERPIIVAYPCNDMVHADFTHCLTLMLLYSAVQARLWIGTSQSRGSIICATRNFLVRQARNHTNGFSHLMMLDSDMTFPPDTLSRLLAHDKPVVGASYCMRREPRAMTHRNEDFSSTLPELGTMENDIYPVLSLGLGCVLVKSEVFDTIRAMDPIGPFFQIEYYGEDHHTGEDVHFFKKVNEARIPVYCDIKLTKEIGHDGIHNYRPSDVQKVYDGTEPKFEMQMHPLPHLSTKE